MNNKSARIKKSSVIWLVCIVFVGAISMLSGCNFEWKSSEESVQKKPVREAIPSDPIPDYNPPVDSEPIDEREIKGIVRHEYNGKVVYYNLHDEVHRLREHCENYGWWPFSQWEFGECGDTCPPDSTNDCAAVCAYTCERRSKINSKQNPQVNEVIDMDGTQSENVPIAGRYPTKIIYRNQKAYDKEEYRRHCEDLGWNFLDCGSMCPPDFPYPCPPSCEFTCEKPEDQ